MSKRWIIEARKLPKRELVHSYILEKTNLKKVISSFEKKEREPFIKSKIHFNEEILRKDVLNSLNRHRPIHFPQAEENSYHYCALTEFEKKIKNLSEYNNAYAQTKLTKIAKTGQIGKLIQSFPHPIIKSRIAVIFGNQPQTTSGQYLWHRDESIFLNLRVNIPIVTSKNYGIQILEIHKKNKKLNVIDFSMKPGFAYVYDTEQTHRAFCRKVSKLDRVHLIIGVAPWFDYDEESQVWTSNEFYGEIHPFEMFKSGLVSHLIGDKSR